MTEQYQRWERDSRYYILHLHTDLFGNWILTRAWGQRGSALGRLNNTPYDSSQAAKQALLNASRRRLQRNYTRVSY